MFELLVIVLFVWLMGKAIGLVFKLSWGAAKVIASVLMLLAMPLLIICLVFVGGVVLLVPVAMIAIAVAILKACVT